MPETPRATAIGMLTMARGAKAKVLILCNTREQADAATAVAARALPDHRRVPFERETPFRANASAALH